MRTLLHRVAILGLLLVGIVPLTGFIAEASREDLIRTRSAYVFVGTVGDRQIVAAGENGSLELLTVTIDEPLVQKAETPALQAKDVVTVLRQFESGVVQFHYERLVKGERYVFCCAPTGQFCVLSSLDDYRGIVKTADIDLEALRTLARTAPDDAPASPDADAAAAPDPSR